MHKFKLNHNELAQYPMVIDGGLSTALNHLGCTLNSNLWTAQLLIDNPQMIVAAHRYYLDAGAKCIITASYQANIEALKTLGLNTKEAEQLILLSIDLAKQAVKNHSNSKSANADDRMALVAASVGPYGAFLANGSEYTGDYSINEEQLTKFHREKLLILDQSGADLLACETIPSYLEAKVLATLLSQMDTPSWVCFSCRDELHLNDGTPIQKAVKLFHDHPRVVAIGVNCTPPQYIAGLIKQIKSIEQDKLIIVYPNSGETYDPINKSWVHDDSPSHWVNQAKDWQRAGAHIIGGCCRIGAEEIKALSAVFA